MDSSDLATQNSRDVGVSPPTHEQSPPHSPFFEQSRMSPTDSSHQATIPRGENLPQPVSEITPIVNNSHSSHRQYNSTGNGLRNGDVRPAFNGNGIGRTKTPSSRRPSRQNSNLSSRRLRASWYTRVADRYGSLELENKGSVARDHLALERTFLAWLRTSLAFASIGIAVTQLFRLSSTSPQSTEGASISSPIISPLLSSSYSDSSTIRINSTSERLRSIGKPLGTTFIGVAILILLVGFHRYFESQYWIIRGKFPASRGSIALIAFVAGALIVTALAVILAISPGAVET